MEQSEQPIELTIDGFWEKVEKRLKNRPDERRGESIMNLLYYFRDDLAQLIMDKEEEFRNTEDKKTLGPDIFYVPDDELENSCKYKLFLEMLKENFVGRENGANSNISKT